MTVGTYKLYGRLGAGSLAPQIVLEEVDAEGNRLKIHRT